MDHKNNIDGKNNQDSNEKKKPHIKKPLNAFMLYMKEMRAKVVAECTLKESAAINQILGRRVRLQLSFWAVMWVNDVAETSGTFGGCFRIWSLQMDYSWAIRGSVPASLSMLSWQEECCYWVILSDCLSNLKFVL